MKFRVTQQEEPNLNITPLIDVVFLLLIFFMVTTTFDRELELKIQLPEAQGEQHPDEVRQLELTVDRDNRYYVNQKQVVKDDVETLQRALAQAIVGVKDPVLIVSADGKASHQAVIRALDAARRAGLVNLTFAVKSDSGS